MTCTCFILTEPSSLHLVGVCEFQQEAPWDTNETNQIELDGTFSKVKEIRHQEDPRGKKDEKGSSKANQNRHRKPPEGNNV